MNLIYTIQVQDGSNKRNVFQTAMLPDDATKEQINNKGEEIAQELFTGEQDGEWYWDSYGETAGRYYSYNVIPCAESFKIFENILI